jgi:hypothetical protein
MFLSVNLLGLFLRSIFIKPAFEKFKAEADEFIKKEVEKYQNSSKWSALGAFLLIIAYLYATFRLGNIGVTAVAIMIMIGRMPDLLREIKSGYLLKRPPLKQTMLFLPNNFLTFIATLLLWAAIPLLYYFLYLFE